MRLEMWVIYIVQIEKGGTGTLNKWLRRWGFPLEVEITTGGNNSYHGFATTRRG